LTICLLGNAPYLQASPLAWEILGGKLLKEFVMNTITSLSQFVFGKGFTGIGNEYLEGPLEE
jgi:hypothetical protein